MICPVSSTAEPAEQGGKSKIARVTRQALDDEEQWEPELEIGHVFVSQPLGIKLGQYERGDFGPPHIDQRVNPNGPVVDLDVAAMVTKR